MNTKEKEIYNVDAAWENIHSRFEKDGLLTAENKIRSIDFYMIVKIAAIFIIGLVISYVAYNSFSSSGHIGMQLAETFTENNIKIIELSDGSVVHINKKSKLYYPENFSNHNRIVELEGEAFFDIEKNPKKPFIIKARNKEIKVLGTSFNVNTNFEGEKVEVFVKTGKVKFYEPGNTQNELILEPDFIGTLDEEITDKRLNKDPNYISWKTKYFDFRNGEKLDKVIATINRAYGVNIVLADSKLTRNILHTTYDNDPLNTILGSICGTYNLSKEEQGEMIILKSK
jgi:ferric-dicitrate binding protein FerR (iron transport regulator)